MFDLLKYKAYQLRLGSIKATTAAGAGHPTSCLSAADLVAALFFNTMRYDPHNSDNPNNDRFILSKGHAAPLLYAAWWQAGVITEQELLTLRQFDSVLEGHPTPRFSQVKVATGSLGCGLSIGVGESLAGRVARKYFRTYVLMGDSECAEGSIWEAAELAAYYKLDKLIGIIDCNRLGQSTETLDGHDTKKLANKFKAFGWHTLEIDGHNFYQIIKALNAAQEHTGSPIMIIAKTIKGKGVVSVENLEGFHGKALDSNAAKQLSPDAYHGPEWKPNLPQQEEVIEQKKITLPAPSYHEPLATRKAYGDALAALGKEYKQVVVLDAEVKNSTFAQTFEEQHKERFFQCFIAEQNMVGMAIGFSVRNYIPFASTFGAFFARAFDQVRMAGIGRNAIRLVGSHAGVSIGSDGPSQMALEDLALMRTVPNALVLYPCDAVSGYKCVEIMANYNDGVSYLRTTREATSVIYKSNEEFKIGGCSILKKNRKSKALIVAAGITVHEALKAESILESEQIYVSIIDAYCIKPLDSYTIVREARECNNTIITVEDHYLQGGLGQAVSSALSATEIKILQLAVTELPRSGKPEELRAWAKIDADAIIKLVKSL
ncbi:MAG: transketolase [Alteromonas naphthalenivorans]|jgi:transketolase